MIKKEESMIPLLRTMTRKSRLGFGKYKDQTIQHLLDMRLNSVLVSSYFKLTSINYMDDILEEIGISEEYRIEKPSSDREMYYKFLKDNDKIRLRTRKGINIMKKENKRHSRSKLQGLNQGHR
jgi:hypothetical protein